MRDACLTAAEPAARSGRPQPWPRAEGAGPEGPGPQCTAAAASELGSGLTVDPVAPATLAPGRRWGRGPRSRGQGQGVQGFFPTGERSAVYWARTLGRHCGRGWNEDAGQGTAGQTDAGPSDAAEAALAARTRTHVRRALAPGRPSLDW